MPVNRAGRTVRAMLTRAKYLAILHTGVPFHQEISVPPKASSTCARLCTISRPAESEPWRCPWRL